MFPADEHYYDQRPQLATNFYFEIIGLLMKEELYEAGQTTLSMLKETVTKEKEGVSTPREDETPSFFGSLPTSMTQLLQILRGTQLNVNMMGNYLLSFVHLLLLYSQKAISLLLWNEQVGLHSVFQL